MSQYKYSLLPQRPETIRMLVLLPSEDNTTQIQFQLVDYTLPTSGTEDHSYEALSYVWGSEDTPQFILIDGQTLPVTENLYTALLYLRQHQLERLLWIDAICINQGDEDEKAQQIQFMPMIYGQASQVIVWLGEPADHSDKAFEMIRLAADDESSEDKPTDIQQEMNHASIVKLLERPWFRRIWVLQEVHAAQDILVMCGNTKIHGYTFSSGLKNLSLSLLRLAQIYRVWLVRLSIFMRGAIFRPGTTSSSGTLSLGELIDMYHARAATKKHDKVYALLGMSSDTPLLPDYKLPWSAVLQQVITYIFSGKPSVRIWPQQDLALIQSRGHILGQRLEVKSDESQNDRQKVRIENIALQLVVTRRGDNRSTLFGRNIQGTIWTLHVSAKPIQKGDIVCLLEGASKPSIIRPYKDYLSLIVTSATPLQKEEGESWDEVFETLHSRHSPIRDMSLLWDWETSYTNSENLHELEAPMESHDTVPESSGMDFEENKRFDNLALIVRDILVQRDKSFQGTRLLDYLKESKLPVREKMVLAAAISRTWEHKSREKLGIDIIGETMRIAERT
ncbi:heterokaryon incompatibility protein-domain-containing protein [Aspergillus caelatus]|uniref:Heterokaryon incompatibility protein-domain-containing protein n=1 Tax=Aspergillus caelatus TaxID=61420 RepID=A0A5N6ZMN9_9EURO|nr:heterokaryon incompatibility protein-domain-containing protein [Aspergillus caelatus]KAE8358705.1 heterokaryon incompatibility protein-domain-containing protein [Aspergillus caelatus]